MHKDYWEKKAMVELVEIPKLEKANLDFLEAEGHLKRSLELESSKAELDYFNGKLTKENLTRLLIRLTILQRNIGLKRKDLKNDMCDPLLLDVLKRRVQKFLKRRVQKFHK